jgi:toxin YoeB
MKKIWLDGAWEEYIEWQTKDKRSFKKINQLIKSIDRNGYQSEGHPEPLSGNLAGCGVSNLQ